MPDLEIVDAHHHLTDLSRPYPWLAGVEDSNRYHGDDRPIRRHYLLDDYLHDVGNLRLIASVHIENGAADALAETQWIQAVHDERTLPSVHVAHVSLLGADTPAHLERLGDYPVVRGIRDILNWHPDPYYSHTSRSDIISDPVWLGNFARLNALGLSFDLQVFPSQLNQAAKLAARFPETRIILDHAGMPIGRDADSWREWRDGMRAVSQQPNIVAKISALGTNDHTWTQDSLRPFVLETIDLFGPARCMFGSNFPVDSLYSTFGDLYGAFDRLTVDFSPVERRQLFAETALHSYDIAVRQP
ncbi:amidohydrolase [Cryobacterium sp. MDB1-18-2]|uniref:amidohydrolase family protein n=1 Tax=unclassified Cryobacterium TaxID=2649013 RepID=UPI00106B8C6F|nr:MULTISPECIES: amidohydrolase family protein [unclassified Cryobacterium]TFB96414.1 amidohydrolase [Cryobacterium sp. MDB2-A-1]TFC10502.1 amidohydrolase [Cryobacterium sp. MDB2-33-2]TFC12698.1 amidohydrolase [Cryobacterium sp. MDB2-A-2]TFC23187.1 amidohydrolase [Cryobacterium sp. MDB1-18-2]TFC40505.1 amidohydrolase [Cryobacterium sp. MDB1-18-1]